jgi:hypothetical protein
MRLGGTRPSLCEPKIGFGTLLGPEETPGGVLFWPAAPGLDL